MPVPRSVLSSLKVTVPVAVDGETVAAKVTRSPKVDGLSDDVTPVNVDALLTIKVPEAELAPKFPCAAYAAFKVCEPALGLGIVKVENPLSSPCVVAAPPSTLNDTFPVGVPVAELTVAVTLPSVPYVIPGALSFIVVAPAPTPKLPEAELAPKFPCAAYAAFKVCEPALGLGIVKVEDPLSSPCVVAASPSTLNDTFPVGVPVAEPTVTVTLPSAPNVTEGAVIIVVVVA
jgi:hypothetical protein